MGECMEQQPTGSAHRPARSLAFASQNTGSTSTSACQDGTPLTCVGPLRAGGPDREPLELLRHAALPLGLQAPQLAALHISQQRCLGHLLQYGPRGAVPLVHGRRRPGRGDGLGQVADPVVQVGAEPSLTVVRRSSMLEWLCGSCCWLGPQGAEAHMLGSPNALPLLTHWLTCSKPLLAPAAFHQ